MRELTDHQVNNEQSTHYQGYGCTWVRWCVPSLRGGGVGFDFQLVFRRQW